MSSMRVQRLPVSECNVALRVTSNMQLQRTVIGRRGHGACASLHYAHAPRWTRGHAAAELRR
jgi:hypothetical protein